MDKNKYPVLIVMYYDPIDDMFLQKQFKNKFTGEIEKALEYVSRLKKNHCKFIVLDENLKPVEI